MATSTAAAVATTTAAATSLSLPTFLTWAPYILVQLQNTFSHEYPLNEFKPNEHHFSNLSSITLPTIISTNPFVLSVGNSMFFRSKLWQLLLLVFGIAGYYFTLHYGSQKPTERGKTQRFWLLFAVFTFTWLVFSSIEYYASTFIFLLYTFVLLQTSSHVSFLHKPNHPSSPSSSSSSSTTREEIQQNEFIAILSQTMWLAMALGSTDIMFLLPHYFVYRCYVKMQDSKLWEKNQFIRVYSLICLLLGSFALCYFLDLTIQGLYFLVLGSSTRRAVHRFIPLGTLTIEFIKNIVFLLILTHYTPRTKTNSQ